MRPLVLEHGGELVLPQGVQQAARDDDAAMSARQCEGQRLRGRDQQHAVSGGDCGDSDGPDLGDDGPGGARTTKQPSQRGRPHQRRARERQQDQHRHRHRELDRSGRGEGAGGGEAASADACDGAREQRGAAGESGQRHAEHHHRRGPHRQRAEQQGGGEARSAHQQRGAPAHQVRAGHREGHDREGEQREQGEGHGDPAPTSGEPPASWLLRYSRSSAVSRSSMPSTKRRIEALRSLLPDSACVIRRAACSDRG